MTRLTCAEALRLAREVVADQPIYTTRDSDADDREQRLAQWVESVLGANLPMHVAAESDQCVHEEGPAMARARAAALLRAADQAEKESTR